MIMTMKNRSKHFFIVLLLLEVAAYSTAFITGPKPIIPCPLFLSPSDNDADRGDQNDDKYSSPSSSIDQNLVRPPINIRKESILFSDNPATAQNNNIARLWKFCKNRLPYVFTGVSKDSSSSSSSAAVDMDKNPIGAIYNMVFVRCPSVLAGVVYSKNLIEGHPLYCDVGFGAAGPFEIPPLFVYGVLLIILR